MGIEEFVVVSDTSDESVQIVLDCSNEDFRLVEVVLEGVKG